MLIAFLAFCTGLGTGYSGWNALLALALLPLLQGRRAVLTLVASLALGLCLQPKLQRPIVVQGGVFQGTAHVLNVPQTVRSDLVMVVESDGRRFRLKVPSNTDINLGDDLRFRARIEPLPQRAVAQKLEVAVLRPVNPVEVVQRGIGPWRAATGLRRAFLSFVERYCTPTAVGLVHALCFNVTGDLGQETYENLRRTGTIHIVSASGMHVTVVSGLIAAILLLTPFPRGVQLGLLGLVLTLYAIAAGFHPPMIRAVTTVMVGSLAYAFGREPDGFSALSAAGIGTLLWEPEAVGNVGFLLSYLSVGGLIAFASLSIRTKTLGGRVWEVLLASLLASFVAWAATAPLLAHMFGQLSLVGLVANLLIVPTLLVIVTGSLIAWLASWALPVSVGILKVFVEPMTGWILGVVETIGRWPIAAMDTPRPWPVLTALTYLLLAALYRERRRPPEELTVW